MTEEHLSGDVMDVSSITVLIRRARYGCDASRDRVLAKLEPFLISMAARHADANLKSKESVSDIVQRSFLKIIESFESFNGSCGAELRGWLKVLVINEVRQIGRKWHSHCRNVQREFSIDKVQLNNDLPEVENGKPIAGMIIEEQIQTLNSVLCELGETEQKIIRLKTAEGLTFSQIAERLDRSVAATSKAYYRSLIRLQKLIAARERL